MRWMAAMIASAVLASGCLTYASYNYTWSSSDRDPETVEILLGIEFAAGLALAIAMITVDDNRADNWGIDLAAGILTPFIIDGAVALGVGTSDFVAADRAP